VQLQPLTILVGRNGSGKSIFLDALAFLRDALRFTVSEAIKRRGGMQSILCRSAESPALSIEIEAAFRDHAAEYVALYGMTLSANQANQPLSVREVLHFEDGTGNRVGRFEVSHGEAKWAENGAAMPSGGRAVVPPDHLYLGVLGEPPFLELADGLRYMGIHNFHPEAIRRPQRPVPGYLLERDGSNLASVIAMLREKDPGLLQRVKEYLSIISPDVQDFDSVPCGEYETLCFRVHSGPGSPPLEFDATSMSDGTLRALAAIMAAFQVVFPRGRPSVIGIEEPEAALHPAAAHALVSALEAATEHTQVLLTTHSGDLLADPKVPLSSVLVVRLREGRTEIAPVDPASREIIRRELYTLADLQRMGQLNLDEEYLEQQAAAKSTQED
jgi:predicted ATPase